MLLTLPRALNLLCISIILLSFPFQPWDSRSGLSDSKGFLSPYALIIIIVIVILLKISFIRSSERLYTETSSFSHFPFDHFKVELKSVYSLSMKVFQVFVGVGRLLFYTRNLCIFKV